MSIVRHPNGEKVARSFADRPAPLATHHLPSCTRKGIPSVGGNADDARSVGVSASASMVGCAVSAKATEAAASASTGGVVTSVRDVEEGASASTGGSAVSAKGVGGAV